MSCNELGLSAGCDTGQANLRVSKAADMAFTLDWSDVPSEWPNPSTATLTVRADEDTTALLTVNQSATGNGSVITITGVTLGVLLKAADLALLPNDATDAAEPWGGVWDLILVDSTGLSQRLLSGAFIAEKR